MCVCVYLCEVNFCLFSTFIPISRLSVKHLLVLTLSRQITTHYCVVVVLKPLNATHFFEISLYASELQVNLKKCSVATSSCQ